MLAHDSNTRASRSCLSLQVKAGFLLNCLCSGVVTLATETWGDAFFDYDYIPWEDDCSENCTNITSYMQAAVVNATVLQMQY